MNTIDHKSKLAIFWMEITTSLELVNKVNYIIQDKV
jgi:hypothetical protein